jgi:hypothetical protein
MRRRRVGVGLRSRIDRRQLLAGMDVCRATPRMPKGGPGTWGLSRRYNGARGAVAFLLFPLPKPSVKPNSVSRWSHARFNLRRAYYGQEAAASTASQ